MKLLVSLNNRKFEDYLDYTNSFIIGLKEFCINYEPFSILEIKEILEKYPHIELFVSINKNIFNNDLFKLEELLIEFSNLNIKGILFYDLAVLSINRRLGLNLPLGWHQGHMVTNYNTCNYYYNEGCKTAYLASEITKDEMLDISQNTAIELMALFLGHPVVSHSKRQLLSNYFNYYNRPKGKDFYKIKSGDSEEYYILEDNNETSILYGNIVNGIKPLVELKDSLAYGILDEHFIDHELFLKLLKFYKLVLDGRENYIKDINDLIGENTGFFYKKTIYKVKDEK